MDGHLMNYDERTRYAASDAIYAYIIEHGTATAHDWAILRNAGEGWDGEFLSPKDLDEAVAQAVRWNEGDD